MFNIAIIGPGQIGQTYAQALKNSKKVNIKAFVGQENFQGRQFAEKYGANYYTSQDEMYNNETIDAVIIATPTFLHAEMVKKAIEHKVNIMCEKPFVLDYSTTLDLIQKANAAGVRLMVMQVMRFWPEYITLGKMVQCGEIGQVKNVYTHRISSHPAWATWHRDPEKSGGGLYDLAIHDIDYLYSVFGKVKSVYAAGVQETTGCWNNISAVIKFKNGVSAVTEVFMDITGEYPLSTAVRINGTQATVEYINKKLAVPGGGDNFVNSFVLYEQGKAPKGLTIPYYNPYAAKVEYFADCVVGGELNDFVPCGDILYVLKVLEAIKKSLETGAVINMD